MNAEIALRETIQLWDALAREPGAQKDEIPGPWCNYQSECPCCEYVKLWAKNQAHCVKCPMLSKWIYFDKFRKVDSYVGNNPCCSDYSPYLRWVEETDFLENERHRLEDEGDEIGESKVRPADYRLRPSEYDIEFFCLLIVELAEEALADLLKIKREAAE